MVESDQGHVASRVSVWNGYLRAVGTWEAPDEARLRHVHPTITRSRTLHALSIMHVMPIMQ